MPWHARYFDSLWSCLEELGVPIGFHSAAAAGEVPQIGDRFGYNLLLRHVLSHPLYNFGSMHDIIGDDNIVFSTDYTHGDSDVPEAVEEFLEMDRVSKESQKKILWDNCARL